MAKNNKNSDTKACNNSEKNCHNTEKDLHTMIAPSQDEANSMENESTVNSSQS